MEGYQYQNRRDFLRYFFGSGLALYGLKNVSANSFSSNDLIKLVILHTNDQHSRIEPFPDNDPKYAGQGGFAKRASLIKKIRATEPNVLLLDAGDIFQGTPYFNMFKGELEYKLMSLMGYDCVTLGNHDFDLGIENLAHQMSHAKFDFVCSNYSLEDTPLGEKVLPYKVYHRGDIKIGVFGIGIELNGLVPDHLYGKTIYKDPLETANKIARRLKQSEKCDYVICLSHLGFKYDDKKISDVVLAEKSKNIDLIIGGHTHTFLNSAKEIRNAENKSVHITQAGWAGIWLGKLEIVFSKFPKKYTIESSYHKIFKNQV